MKIKKINYGIAFCVQDGNKRYIEVNKNLHKYPSLYKSTLQHEMEHLKSKNNNIDFWIDFKQFFNTENYWEMMKFTFENPKSLLCMSPILIDNKRISFNWFNIVVLGGILGVITGGIFI